LLAAVDSLRGRKQLLLERFVHILEFGEAICEAIWVRDNRRDHRGKPEPPGLLAYLAQDGRVGAAAR
jgi:hypothetical protein